MEDSHPTDHLWEFHVVPAGMEIDNRDDLVMRLIMGGERESDQRQKDLCIGSDADIADAMFREMQGSEFVRQIHKHTKISELRALEVGGSIHLKYDFG